jgi:diguanylate cyclase (GGDEF)-like protein
MSQQDPEVESSTDHLPRPVAADPLTGLISRRAFEEQYVKLFEQARAEEKPLSLAIIDIDDLMGINDKFGHIAGDAALKMVADKVMELVGEDTITGRVGGDEFALLFPDTEREQAFLALERIRAEIEKNQDLMTRVTVRGGLATYPIDGRSGREIMRKADQALYTAFITGKNKICLARDDRKVTKTTHYTPTQLERLAKLAEDIDVGEAELLREALDDLLRKYDVELRGRYKGEL